MQINIFSRYKHKAIKHNYNLFINVELIDIFLLKLKKL